METTEAFKSLFSLDNPFRRKPSSQSSPSHLQENPSENPKKPVSIDGFFSEEASGKRKPKKNPSFEERTHLSSFKEEEEQRKKENESSDKKKKKKRDELERERTHLSSFKEDEEQKKKRDELERERTHLSSFREEERQREKENESSDKKKRDELERERTHLSSFKEDEEQREKENESFDKKKKKKRDELERERTHLSSFKEDEEHREKEKGSFDKKKKKKRDELEREYEMRKRKGDEKENGVLEDGFKEDKKLRKERSFEEEKKKKKKRKRDEVENEDGMRNLSLEETQKKDSEVGSSVVSVGRKRKGDEREKDFVLEESFDDESKLLRTVFVGNLPLKTKRKALVKEFSGFGEVESIRLRSVPILDTKVPRKGAIIRGQVNESVDSMNAYIVFKDEQSARAALVRNMSKFLGNHIRVDIACPPRKKMKTESPLYNIKRTIFVGNLPFDIKDEEVYAFFCEDSILGSDVEAVRVVRDPQTSLGKGIAYVLLKTRDAANTAVRRKNWKLRDRILRVSHARSDPSPSNKPVTPQKRKITDHNVIKASKTGGDATPSSGDRKPSKSGALSYQGLRASNKRSSGAEKKPRRTSFRPSRSNPTGSSSAQASDSLKMKKTKRPAVAARKAKALREQGKKRKPEAVATMNSEPPRKKPRRAG